MSNRVHFRGGSLAHMPDHGFQIGPGPAMPRVIGVGAKRMQKLTQQFPPLVIPPNRRPLEMRLAIYRKSWPRMDAQARAAVLRDYPELEGQV